MSDIVERLRERAADWRKQTSRWMLDPRVSEIDPVALMAMVRNINDEAADRIAELEARVKVLETFNSELRRYLYDRTPERREKVVERFALNPSARSE